MVTGACTAVMASCQQRASRALSKKIGDKCNSRFLDMLLSHEDYGGASSFLRRATWDGVAKLKHVQAPTNKNGLSTDPRVIKKQFMKTFSEWFRARRRRCGEPAHPLGTTPVADMYVGRGSPKQVTEAIELGELLDSLARVPQDSCPGPSRISVQLLRICPEIVTRLLCMMLNMCLDWGILPQSFQEGFILPIPKKGALTVDNSRPISLLEVHLKLLTRIVNRRLIDKLLAEDFFCGTQFGFLPGRSCTDAFHILYGVVEDALEHNKPLHLCLVDLTKAFDSLSPEALQRAYAECAMLVEARVFQEVCFGVQTILNSFLLPLGPSRLHDGWSHT